MLVHVRVIRKDIEDQIIANQISEAQLQKVTKKNNHIRRNNSSTYL